MAALSSLLCTLTKCFSLPLLLGLLDSQATTARTSSRTTRSTALSSSGWQRAKRCEITTAVHGHTAALFALLKRTTCSRWRLMAPAGSRLHHRRGFLLSQTAMHSLSGTPTLLHFGDTPNDIKAAVAAGAVPVGIATGAFSLEQLRESARVLGAEGSLILLADLTDTTRVLEAIERATLARA